MESDAAFKSISETGGAHATRRACPGRQRAQVIGQLFETDEIVCRKKVVHVPQRRAHAPCERLGTAPSPAAG